MITIRQADLTKCTQYFQVVLELLIAGESTATSEEFLNIRVDDGNTFFIMECSEYGVIGAADIRCDAVADYTLVSLVIDLQHRDKGLGSQLLDYIENHVSSIEVVENDIKLKCKPGSGKSTYYLNRGYNSDGFRMVKTLIRL